MKFTPCDPPRAFAVGREPTIELKDCGRLELAPDEQVTFVGSSGSEYDVARKSWGYYAAPSLNRRLPAFGLRAVLAENGTANYLLLVEMGKEREFFDYLAGQGMCVRAWLSEAGESCSAQNGNAESPWGCFLCGGTRMSPVFRYDAPPQGETRFESSTTETYFREIFRCQTCGHFISHHEMDLAGLYRGAYVDATYGAGGIAVAYRRIMALPEERSDNTHRVRRIVEYFAEACGRLGVSGGLDPTVLDIGSGLCVFLARMKEEEWDGTALDPDPNAARHAEVEVGVRAVCGDFMKLDDLGSYDLITFNKVLEHVVDPVAMLAKSRAHLSADGVVYVEVPDGEMAALAGAEREEFFIEHFGAFSLTSLSLLASKAGFSVRWIERIREPSGKYTLRAFLQEEKH